MIANERNHATGTGCEIDLTSLILFIERILLSPVAALKIEHKAIATATVPRATIEAKDLSRGAKL